MSEARALDPAKHRDPIPQTGDRRPHLLANTLWKEPEYRGLELQRIRQSLGLSGHDVASALGIGINKIVYAETGHPSYEAIRRLEQAFLRQHIIDHWPRVG